MTLARAVTADVRLYACSSPPQEQLKVVLGEHDRCRADRRTTRFSIERILTHPAYRHEDYHADLALLRLSMRLTFSRTVRPICLPAPGESFAFSVQPNNYLTIIII